MWQLVLVLVVRVKVVVQAAVFYVIYNAVILGQPVILQLINVAKSEKSCLTVFVVHLVQLLPHQRDVVN